MAARRAVARKKLSDRATPENQPFRYKRQNLSQSLRCWRPGRMAVSRVGVRAEGARRPASGAGDIEQRVLKRCGNIIDIFPEYAYIDGRRNQCFRASSIDANVTNSLAPRCDHRLLRFKARLFARYVSRYEARAFA
jgi:hypothetical protein